MDFVEKPLTSEDESEVEDLSFFRNRLRKHKDVYNPVDEKNLRADARHPSDNTFKFNIKHDDPESNERFLSLADEVLQDDQLIIKVEEEKPYYCDNCASSFNRKDITEEEFLKHLEECSDLFCMICQKRFKQDKQRDYENHVYSHLD